MEVVVASKSLQESRLIRQAQDGRANQGEIFLYTSWIWGGTIKAETNPKVFAFGPVIHQIQQEAPSRRWDSCDIMYLSHVELCLAKGLSLLQPHPS